MDKQGSKKSPKPALHEIVEAEEQVLLGKLGISLPSPEACHYASEYDEGVDSQLIVGGSSCSGAYLMLASKTTKKTVKKGMGEKIRGSSLTCKISGNRPGARRKVGMEKVAS